ncbi:MAG: TIGR03936 family radical SAM-associated protein [Candidatus Margulisiibacteriota bacterium]
MFRVSIKYTKGEEVKFISHRDLMRVFQRAIRRADIPIAYSQGFNPHIKISWGNALKLGRTSDNESAELHMQSWIKPEELMRRLNQELPKGIEILEANLV